MGALERLFQPRGVAVVGASTDPVRVGGAPVKALAEYGKAIEQYGFTPQQILQVPGCCARQCQHQPDQQGQFRLFLGRVVLVAFRGVFGLCHR